MISERLSNVLIGIILAVLDILAIMASLQSHDPFYAGAALVGTGLIGILYWDLYRERYP